MIVRILSLPEDPKAPRSRWIFPDPSDSLIWVVRRNRASLDVQPVEFQRVSTPWLTGTGLLVDPLPWRTQWRLLQDMGLDFGISRPIGWLFFTTPVSPSSALLRKQFIGEIQSIGDGMILDSSMGVN